MKTLLGLGAGRASVASTAAGDPIANIRKTEILNVTFGFICSFPRYLFSSQVCSAARLPGVQFHANPGDDVRILVGIGSEDN